MLSTPKEVVRRIEAYLDGAATWDEVKALVAETTFTHREKPEFGRDDSIDAESWEDTVGLIFKLPTDKETELKKLANMRERAVDTPAPEATL